MVNSTLLHLATGAVFAYNGLSRVGALQYDRKSDITSRNAKLLEYSISQVTEAPARDYRVFS